MLKRHLIGTFIIGIVGAILGAAIAYVLYPVMGVTVFVLVGGVCMLVGVIGGLAVAAWAYW